MTKQTSSKTSGQVKKHVMLQLTGKSLMLWVCLIFLVCGWMFVLGVLVGRGTAPVHFDVEALQKELIALKESMLKKEKDVIELHFEKGQVKNTLDFYEALKGKTKDDTIEMPPKKKETETSITAAVPSNTQASRPSDPADNAPQTAKFRKSGDLAIQVASTKDPKSADEMVAGLRRKGYEAFSLKAEIPEKGTWYRVRVGYFKDRAEAEAIRGQLAKEKYQGIIVRN